MNSVTVSADGLTAREDNVANVTTTFIWSFGAEYPGISALQTSLWLG
jgi:hypothetical protein